MKVLMIGGTQYFGKIIVQSLLDRGDEVTMFTRGNSRPDFWDDVDHIIGDRTDYDDFKTRLQGKSFDAVIDTIAFRVEDTCAVAEALAGDAGKYLVASTVSIYGGAGHAHEWTTVGVEMPSWQRWFVDIDTNCPIAEDLVDPSTVSWEYDDRISDYGQGKRQIERFLHETPEFPSVVIRVPGTMGPEDHTLRFWWYMQRLLDGREILMRDGGTNLLRLGFRDDVARAFIDAMDSPNTVNQMYDVCQAEVSTFRNTLEVMADACGVDLNAVSIPGDVAETHSSLPWADWGFDPYSRGPNKLWSIEKARRDFDLHSTPITEWIGQTVDWYREHHDGRDSKCYERRDEEVALARWWRQEYGAFLDRLETKH